ncbi:hypothetical protein B9Z19DRAFT_1137352 [Tuber borchii]|uniref:Uncharacterized protein n=1 Tax=Tuber borchii TaxID=42251 RepID=A0A2T6ZAK8_TUBBO|nr:hypothetical protein B9Z19DRAFT_1137352 [Tuber borchii]
MGEQIWRPTHTILDERVQCPNTDTSLQWPDFLRFRVLEETTPWEHWFHLYSKEHSGRKPLMRDCYLTHGWNKQAKTPIWLPRLVRNSGTLRAILEQWFTSPKDKVTIIFEYINKDQARVPTELVVAERFSDLNITLSDDEPLENVTSNPNSPIPVSRLSSDHLYSSPPLPTTATPAPIGVISNNQTAILVRNHRTPISLSQNQETHHLEPHLVSSPDPEPPPTEQPRAPRPAMEPDSGQSLTSINVWNSVDRSSLSLLSTIPDSPEINPQPPIALPDSIRTTAVPLRSTSKRNRVQMASSSPPQQSIRLQLPLTTHRVLPPRAGREQALKRVRSACELNEK